jgi:hypothetical protein
MGETAEQALSKKIVKHAGVEIAEEMGFKPEVGDQRNSDVTALGVGEPAVTPEPGVNNIVEARRARSSYLVACRA